MSFILTNFVGDMKQIVFDFNKPFKLRFTDRSERGFCLKTVCLIVIGKVFNNR